MQCFRPPYHAATLSTSQYAEAEKQTAEKVRICHLLSFFLTSSSLQTKAVIELLHAQNNIAFVVVALFSCLSANWQAWVAVLASCGSAKLVQVQTYTNCACAVHKQTFTTLCLCILGDYQILVNPTFGGRWLLGGIFCNLYLSVSIMSSWRRGFLSWYISSEHLIHMYCQAEVFYSWDMQNCGAIAVIESMAYMTIVELFDDIPHPLLPWGSGRFKGGDPPLVASNVFCIHNCTSPSNGYEAVAYSNNNQAQLHTRVSISLLISRCLTRPTVALRYSVRTSSYFKQLTHVTS